MIHAELPVTGYLSRLSARPGETITAHVSLGHASPRDGGHYRARLERMICADPHPDGPGRRIEDLSALFDREFAGARQPIHLGSHIVVPAGPLRDAQAACTWTALVWPGRPDRIQTVLHEACGDVTVTLSVGPEGAMAELNGLGGGARVATGQPLAPRRWHRVWLSADPATGEIVVGQLALEQGGHARTPDTAATVARGIRPGLRLPGGGGAVTIAASDAADPHAHFDGRIEDPAILSGWTDGFADPCATLADFAGALLAGWDFAQGIDGAAIVDTGPSGRHGVAVNLPARAMAGIRWTGRETCWRHAPGDYAAIHFHSDDLEDCGWEPGFAFTIPAGLRSGCYLLHLTCAAGEDWLPFYVLPARDGKRAPIAFLAATFTYIAYANHARGNVDDAHRARVAAWGAYPHNPQDYPIYGVSTYNRHPDGSGVSLSSRLRPILTMRPGFFTFNDPRGSGTRHFVADSHLLAWLEEKGHAFDVVTDEDLDDEGLGLIQPYAAVLTGSHPEYHTERMLDALLAYTRGGGRLAYLGGNGFYWRIARDPARPHAIEIRRAEGGVRAWAAEPGEYCHQLDGQLGGMWRRNRRPPQQLAGVGFSGQGLFEGTYFRRLPASNDPAYGWLFEGIPEEIIGDYGLSGGGAAGFEFDRADRDLGTPDNAAILARSENPPDSAEAVLEELLSHLATVTGETRAALVRAEIVYFTTPAGGEVFSVGSITFCGSLWRNGFEGPVSRLLENVVRRFARARSLAGGPALPGLE
jgi:N,N-dimethylformamidase